MQALLIPLDDRPVTYILPQLVARIAGIQTASPPRNLMGSLKKPAQPEQLIAWIDSWLQQHPDPDGLLLCLDSLLYGGLINSRRCPDSLADILQRATHLTTWHRQVGNRCPVLAQSSIMRISDNYDATEEKDYWARFGREIFTWSAYLHRLLSQDKLASGALPSAEQRIPQEVREDYLRTRLRNFQVNRRLLEYACAGTLDFLAFSLDDSGEHGLNVLEQKRLLASSLPSNDRITSYAGADEVLCALLSRLLVQIAGSSPVAQVQFSPQAASLCPSRYEGQTIGQTVAAQLKACAIQSGPQPADFLVLVHGSSQQQGDHIWLPGLPDQRVVDTREAVKETLKLLEQSQIPCVLCDVAYANGADPTLVEKLLLRPELMAKLWGYAGWNTTGNSVGSALSMGVASWFAARSKNQPAGSLSEPLKQSLFVRLSDDWAYQAVTRRELTKPIELSELAEKMDPLFKRIAQALHYQPAGLRLGFPWERTFEIEVLPAELSLS